MKTRRFLSFSIPAIALVASLAAARALPGQETDPASATRAFRMDGRRYAVDGSLSGDALLLGHLARRMGIPVPVTLTGEGSTGVSTLPISVLLHEESDGVNTSAIPLPAVFRPVRALELETGTGTVNIVLGTIPRGRGAVRRRLSNSDWEWADTCGDGEITEVLSRHARGGESIVAFLDEKEGKFILFRRLDHRSR